MGERYTTEDPNDLIQRIKELTKRVENLEAGNRIGFTGVNAGSLNVSGGVFRVGVAVYFGPVVLGGDTSNGWILRRADGTIVFQLAGVSNSDQFWGFQDNEGNLILTDDGATNRGLGRPYLSTAFGLHFGLTFPANTTSASFTGLWIGRMPRQHPRIQVDCLTKPSDGTTAGEIQLKNNTTGQIIAGPTAISAGVTSLTTLGPTNFDTGTTGPGLGFASAVELEIQARRTAGAGNIGVEVYGAWGLQS